MESRAFDFILSTEHTSTNDNLHANRAATEWWVTFYKPETVEPAPGLPNRFLATDRSNHDDYERAPYAMAFRSLQGGNDFVLILVHLQPGDRNADRSRRQHELSTIADRVDSQDAVEKDFFIICDMNFENCAEIAAILPTGFQALNAGAGCETRNTNVNNPRRYDNTLLTAAGEDELVADGEFAVIDLIEAMRVPWFEDSIQSYPGDAPYDHDGFRVRYSDRQPIRFRLRICADDD